MLLLAAVGAIAWEAVGRLFAPVQPAGLTIMVVAAIGVAMAITRTIDGRRVPCAHCGEPIRPGALVCIHCKADQKQAIDAAGA